MPIRLKKETEQLISLFIISGKTFAWEDKDWIREAAVAKKILKQFCLEYLRILSFIKLPPPKLKTDLYIIFIFSKNNFSSISLKYFSPNCSKISQTDRCSELDIILSKSKNLNSKNSASSLPNKDLYDAGNPTKII